MLRFLPFLAVLCLCITACDPESGIPEPNVESIRLTVGAQSVTVNRDAECTGCPLVLSDGDVVTAQFLTAAGQPDPVATRTEYRLSALVAVNPIGLAFEQIESDRFALTFHATGVSSTPINVKFWLRHLRFGHDDFPPTDVAVIVE